MQSRLLRLFLSTEGKKKHRGNMRRLQFVTSSLLILTLSHAQTRTHRVRSIFPSPVDRSGAAVDVTTAHADPYQAEASEFFPDPASLTKKGMKFPEGAS